MKETDLSRSQVGSAGRRITRVLHFLIAFPAFTSRAMRRIGFLDKIGGFKIKDHFNPSALLDTWAFHKRDYGSEARETVD